MKTTTQSGNGCSESCVCESTVLCRPRYFPRQLITPEEMILEAQYFRDKLRHHNRLMHGWGVVCGAGVCRVPKSDQPESQQAKTGPEYEPWKVLVKPGYILGPCGDEIIIECNQIKDLRKQGVTSVSSEPCPEEVDPWCSDPETTPHEHTIYVAVKYQEIMTRPIRVQPVGCGCDDTPCEYSRWCDGYEIGILDACPHESPTLPANTDTLKLEHLRHGAIPDCPECPTKPWVGLAAVTIDEKGIISDIDNCSCRRLVVSLATLWWQCQRGVGKSVGEGSRQTVIKSAISGQFVGKSYAKSHPKTTFRERVISGKKKKKNQ
jgi:hypothetical protein